MRPRPRSSNSNYSNSQWNATELTTTNTDSCGWPRQESNNNDSLTHQRTTSMSSYQPDPSSQRNIKAKGSWASTSKQEIPSAGSRLKKKKPKLLAPSRYVNESERGMGFISFESSRSDVVGQLYDSDRVIRSGDEEDEAAAEGGGGPWNAVGEWFNHGDNGDITGESSNETSSGTNHRPIPVMDLDARERDMLQHAHRKQHESILLSRDQDVLARSREHYKSRQKSKISSAGTGSWESSYDASGSQLPEKQRGKSFLKSLFGGGGSSRGRTKQGSGNNSTLKKTLDAPSLEEYHGTDATLLRPPVLQVDTEALTPRRRHRAPKESQFSFQEKPPSPIAIVHHKQQQHRGNSIPRSKYATDTPVTKHENHLNLEKISDDSTVSEMTNPTFFQKVQKDRGPPKIISSPRRKMLSVPPINTNAGKPPISAIQTMDPFDVDSPVFHAAFGPPSRGGTAATNALTSAAPSSLPYSPSPRSKFTSPIGSDEFSDPFFPPSSGGANTELSDVPDPALDHVQVESSDDSDNNDDDPRGTEEKKVDTREFQVASRVQPGAIRGFKDARTRLTALVNENGDPTPSSLSPSRSRLSPSPPGLPVVSSSLVQDTGPMRVPSPVRKKSSFDAVIAARGPSPSRARAFSPAVPSVVGAKTFTTGGSVVAKGLLPVASSTNTNATMLPTTKSSPSRFQRASMVAAKTASPVLTSTTTDNAKASPSPARKASPAAQLLARRNKAVLTFTAVKESAVITTKPLAVPLRSTTASLVATKSKATMTAAVPPARDDDVPAVSDSRGQLTRSAPVRRPFTPTRSSPVTTPALPVSSHVPSARVGSPISVSPGMSEKLKKRQQRRTQQKTLIPETGGKQEGKGAKAGTSNSPPRPSSDRPQTDSSERPYRGRLNLIRSPSPETQQRKEESVPVKVPSPTCKKHVSEFAMPHGTTSRKFLLSGNNNAASKANARSPPRSLAIPQASRTVPVKKSARETSQSLPTSRRSDAGSGSKPCLNNQAPPTSTTKSERSSRIAKQKPELVTSDSDDDTICSVANARADIRRLRTYIRKSRKNADSHAPIPDAIVSTFSAYDESSVQDPLHRAGLRLLSGAVIPIQSAARRHLALRRALTRMWAIVILQSLARRWLAETKYSNQILAATAVQAWYRGCCVRDEQLLQQCCAIEIQRHVRGYLATIRVYEGIFRITIAQSVVRRKQAIDRATDRMIFVIQLQALARGFLRRRHLSKLNNAALVIQTKWRGFFCRFNYQLDLLDIIIVQSIWRRNAAISGYREMLWSRKETAATLIQSQWRACDGRRKFYALVAAILIQSQWRSYVCRRHFVRYRSATAIQAQWRCAAASRSYLQYIAAMMIQAQVRRYLCQQPYNEFIAARTIQAQVRRSLCETKYQEFISARTIQTQVRRYLCQQPYEEFIAARTIQAHMRRCLCETKYAIYNAAKLMQAQVRGFICQRKYVKYTSARKIQAHVRGYLCQQPYIEYVSARKIQAQFRGHVVHQKYNEFISARKIQAQMRRCLCEREYAIYTAAKLIQAQVRGFLCETKYAIYTAVKLIQAQVRGFLCQRKYMKYTSARKIQAHVRRYLHQQPYKKFISARTIQAQMRRCLCETKYAIYTAAKLIQAQVRGFLCQRKYMKFTSARKIQAQMRRYLCQQPYIEYVSARKIQAQFRGHMVHQKYTQYRSNFRRYVAASIIQAQWRSYDCSHKYLQLIAAIMIQAQWRCYVCRKRVIERAAATTVQSIWRSYVCSRDYLREVAAIMVQAQWRSHVCASKYRRGIAATKIQAEWRSFQCSKEYLEIVAARMIQATWRAHVCTRDYEIIRSASRIQRRWRTFTCRRDYIRLKSAISIQSQWRSFVCSLMFLHTMADILIVQSVVRRWLAQRSVVEYTNRQALVIQASFRRYCGRQLLYKVREQTNAAVTIQRVWRGFVTYANHMFTVADIVIVQSLARRLLAIKKTKAIRVIRYNHAARVLQRVARERANVKLWAAIRIQCMWRGFVGHAEFLIAKYEKDAATTIQSCWRRFWLSSTFLIAVDSAILIQTTFRRFREQMDFDTKLGAIIGIQRSFRFHQLRKYNHQNSLISKLIIAAVPVEAGERQSATLIQAAVRKYQVRASFTLYLMARKIQTAFRRFRLRNTYVGYTSARRIQTVWRGYCARWFFLEYIAARDIQAFWRGARLHTLYQQYRAAVRLQSFWRQKKARANFVMLREVLMADVIVAAIFVQSVWRGSFVRMAGLKFTKWQTRLFVEDPAATEIQKVWRGFNAMQEYWNCLGSTIQIQAAIRGWFSRRCLRRDLVQASAATCIQSIVRMVSVRQKCKEVRAATKIQSSFRRAIAVMFFRSETSAIRLQAAIRRFLARAAVAEKLGVIIFLQSIGRRYIANVEAAEKLGAIIFMQSFGRRYIANVEAKRRRLISTSNDSVKSNESSTTKSAENTGQVNDSSTTRTAENSVAEMDWEVAAIRFREERAARTIQRFFIMVKREVDREIQAAKKRRKARKKHKRRVSNIDPDDDVLENVWRTTVESQEFPDEILRSRMADELGSGRCSVTPRERNGGGGGGGGGGDDVYRIHSMLSSPGRPSSRACHYPPSSDGQHARLFRQGSGLCESPSLPACGSHQYRLPPSPSPRVPPSRFSNMSSDEMDQDFNLEEAWIDTEIYQAKERRRNEKKRSSKHSRSGRRSSTPTVQQQQQQQQRMPTPPKRTMAV